MNIQKLLVITMALLCAACANQRGEINLLSESFNDYTVVLIPNLATKVLDIYNEAQGFESTGKEKGWVGFYPRTNGTISFTINALPLNPVCTDDPKASADWVISRIRLSQNGNPQTQKGRNFGNPQTGWIVDSFPQMNRANGEIEDPRINSISVDVYDLNNHRGKQTAYYQITATQCSTGLELTTDPGVRNGGR